MVLKSNLKEGESLEINVWDRRDKNALGKLFAVSDRFLGSARLTPKLVEKFIDAGGNVPTQTDSLLLLTLLLQLTIQEITYKIPVFG